MAAEARGVSPARGLAYILLIESETIGATLLTRQRLAWEPSDYDTREDVIELPEIGCRLALAEAYEGPRY